MKEIKTLIRFIKSSSRFHKTLMAIIIIILSPIGREIVWGFTFDYSEVPLYQMFFSLILLSILLITNKSIRSSFKKFVNSDKSLKDYINDNYKFLLIILLTILILTFIF